MDLQQKPTLVNVIAWTTLASGIVNLFWGLVASQTALATVIGLFCIRLSQTCTFGVPRIRGISSLLSVNLYLDSKV